MQIDTLAPLGLVIISGLDAKKFLQGQLTCDLETVTEATPQLGAHCNPQGRIISLFKIYQQQSDYHLKMPKDLVPLAMKALQKYAVFFKVTLTDASLTLGDETPWQHENILRSMPIIYADTSEKFLPHEINLPELNGVSFNKGCYTGQEIIARMHYRGKQKSFLYRATVETASSLKRGHDIYSDQTSGKLVDFFQVCDKLYELLVVASNKELFFIDPEKKDRLHFL